jgi:hypothetical protein
MPAPLTPAERLSKLRQSLPAETQIADALSLAVRVEPALLRDVRLILFPRSKASLEADLYFSPLVSQRTTDWITLDPQLSLELQNELTASLKQTGARSNRILQAREAIVRVHRRAPFEIATEEEVIWLAVRRQGSLPRVRAAIDARLRDLLMRMLRASEESVALARWFASAAHRMPSLARETEAFSVLVFATSSTLGGRKIETKPNPSLATFEVLARYLPESAKRIPLWMGLTTRGVHILPSAAPGYERVEAPLTNPVLLDVRGGDTVRHLVQVTPGQAAFVPLATQNIVVRTLLRDSLNFRPRAQRTESAVPASQAKTSNIKQIFVSHGVHDREFVSRLREDLVSRRYDVWVEADAASIAIMDWRKEIESAMARMDCMIAVVSLSPSKLVHDQLDLALDRGRPIIPILRSGDAGLLPYRLRSLTFVDFRENVPYDQAFETLLKALTHWETASPSEGELVDVPPLPEHYTSRPEIMRELEDLTSGKDRVVALVGRAGTGKTSLAIAYAHELATREAFPGGIVWLNAIALEEDELRRRATRKQPHLFILPDVRSIEEVSHLSTVMGEHSRLLFTLRGGNLPGWVRTIHLDRSRVYLSYSYKDKIWFDRLFGEQSRFIFDVWDDTRVASDEKRISEGISYARVAVLLVSANYLASDIIMHKQLPLVLEAANRGELRVVWVPISASLWSSTPLAKFQAAIDPSTPFESLEAGEQRIRLAQILTMIGEPGGQQPLR